MIKVKICGITNLEDALLASKLGADSLGFIFAKKSPRCLSQESAKKIIQQLDPFLIKVGVFLDQAKEEVLNIATNINLDVLQFHGSESPAYCRSFKPKFRIIKVFFPEDQPYSLAVSRYNCDAYMFDIKYDRKIKGSKLLSRECLKEISEIIKSGRRVILSGGLDAENVDRVKVYAPYALDAASGIEKLVGKKDEELLSLFIERVKK